MAEQTYPGFVKATMFFSTPEGAGWSESFYFANPGTKPPQTIATELSSNRCFYLGSGAYITVTRIKDLGGPRKVQLFSTARAGQWADVNEVAEADSANTVVLMPYVTVTGAKRNVAVGGIPDSALQRHPTDLTFHMLDVSKKYLGGWYNFLMAAPYALQIKERSHIGKYARFSIVSIGVHTNGRYKITLDDPWEASAGEQVAFEGLKGGINLAGLGGVRKVIDVIDDSTFTVNSGPRQDLGVPVYLGGGTVSIVGYVMNAAANTAQPYVVSTRNRGKVFTRRRGRRSNKKK